MKTKPIKTTKTATVPSAIIEVGDIVAVKASFGNEAGGVVVFADHDNITFRTASGTHDAWPTHELWLVAKGAAFCTKEPPKTYIELVERLYLCQAEMWLCLEWAEADKTEFGNWDDFEKDVGELLSTLNISVGDMIAHGVTGAKPRLVDEPKKAA
ncbi:MAG TPA: hypothetical protein PK402_04145 [Tepidisphaeraceae bacterium]|nr:hypothetical protein [Tepidisphaeraceae bacterium]